jgi:hypothetical protein
MAERAGWLAHRRWVRPVVAWIWLMIVLVFTPSISLSRRMTQKKPFDSGSFPQSASRGSISIAGFRLRILSSAGMAGCTALWQPGSRYCWKVCVH